jgi:hypothetical protein
MKCPADSADLPRDKINLLPDKMSVSGSRHKLSVNSLTLPDNIMPVSGDGMVVSWVKTILPVVKMADELENLHKSWSFKTWYSPCYPVVP